MFKKPTVFILGAGASWHYGYPTGEGLVREVRKKCSAAGSYFRDSVQQPIGHMPLYVSQKLRDIEARERLAPVNAYQQAWSTAQHDCDELAQRLRNVDPLVIDYFLGQNAELQPLGKLLIAWVLRERETAYKMERRNVNRETAAQDNWLRFIIHRLVVGCDTSRDLLKNDVTFVTFNYDMSAEDQVFDGLCGNSFFSHQDVMDFLHEKRFLHVYGKIRDNDAAFAPLTPLSMSNGKIDPSFAKSYFDELHRTSQGIDTIDPKKTDTQAFRDARTAIGRAECIYILGFGFDRRNCQRLGLEPGTFQVAPGARPRRILFTNYEDLNRVNKEASKTFLGFASAFLGAEREVVDLLGSRGNYYEKSRRNCYDALALDFDEIEAE